MAEAADLSHEVELRLAMLRHWYGDQLSAEQWEEVRRQVRRGEPPFGAGRNGRPGRPQAPAW